MTREYRRRAIEAADRTTYHREWARQRRRELGAVGALVCNHKLTVQRAREVLALRGDGCDLCGREAKLVYDHDHATDKFRGWICYRCNTGLHMQDDPELLALAHAYLERANATV